MQDDETQTLVAAAQAGDTVALARLFERYLPITRRFVRARLRRLSDLGLESEDLVQTALTIALLRLDGFEWRGESSFRYWVGSITTHCVVDLMRKRGAAPLPEQNDERKEAGLASVESASDVAMKRETEDALSLAISELSTRDREVILMRNMCEMPFEQIAIELDLKNAASARAAYSRALARLSSKFAEDHAEDDHDDDRSGP